MLADATWRRVVTLYPDLAHVPDALTRRVRAEGQLFRAPVGAVLFDLEGPCTGFVLVLEGEVDVTRPSPNGRELLLYRLLPGDTCVLTLNCLLGQGTYPARAVVRRPVTGLMLPRPLFALLLDEVAAFRAGTLALFSRRMTRLLALIEGVAFAPVEQRLASLLVERGPVVAMTQQQLADAVGTAREVVSRQLGVWADAGLIETGRGALRVVRPDRVAAIAEPLGGP